MADIPYTVNADLSETFVCGTTEGFQVKMSNSIGEGELKASGGGSLTISNYMKKFQVKDFFSGISSEKGCYEMSFTLPLGAIEEDK